MNHNPRKFEEKIALNKQKQAEQTKQFQEVIRESENIRDNDVSFEWLEIFTAERRNVTNVLFVSV